MDCSAVGANLTTVVRTGRKTVHGSRRGTKEEGDSSPCRNGTNRAAGSDKQRTPIYVSQPRRPYGDFFAAPATALGGVATRRAPTTLVSLYWYRRKFLARMPAIPATRVSCSVRTTAYSSRKKQRPFLRDANTLYGSSRTPSVFP